MTVAKKRPLPDRLRAIRQRRDLTQAELAEKVGVFQTAISQFEQGRAQPSIETLYRIAEALGVSAAELLENPA